MATTSQTSKADHRQPSRMASGSLPGSRTKSFSLQASCRYAWFTRHFSSRRAYIYVLEIVSQVLPLLYLRHELPQHVLLFCDNEPGRLALVKATAINKLLQSIWSYLEDRGIWPEWQGVSSGANISDAVSRFSFAQAYAEDWSWTDLDLDHLLERILDAALGEHCSQLRE